MIEPSKEKEIQAIRLRNTSDPCYSTGSKEHGGVNTKACILFQSQKTSRQFLERARHPSLLRACFKHGLQSIIHLWMSSAHYPQNTLYNSALRQGTAIRRDLDALADGSETSPALLGADIPDISARHSAYDSRSN